MSKEYFGEENSACEKVYDVNICELGLIRAGPRYRPGVGRPRALARRGPNFFFYRGSIF